MKKTLAALTLCAISSGAIAETYLAPITTAMVNGHSHAFQNDSASAVQCEVESIVPSDTHGRTFRTTVDVAEGETRVEQGVPPEVRADRTLRFTCSGTIAIAVGLKTSDDGRPFGHGNIDRAVKEDQPIVSGASRIVRTTTELLLMEVSRKHTRVSVIAKDTAGAVLGQDTFELKPFGYKLLPLQQLLSQLGEITLELHVAHEGGAIVVAAPTTESRFLTTARRVQDTEAHPITSLPSVTRSLATSPFKAAPFRDPATGLDYLRNRWFAPETATFLSPDPLGFQDSSNLYAFASGDPVNRHDPAGLCLGLDKADKPCGEYARKLPDFLAETLGLQDLPSTGDQTIDQKIRQAAQTPLRVAAVPATTLLSTGESLGEVAYRMERSTFHGEPALEGSVDDALLVATAIGDVATVAMPVGMLSGAPELIGSRASQRGSILIRRRKKQAEELVAWVDEGGDLRAGASPGMRPDAYLHQSSAPGSRSNVLTGRGQAPYLEFTDPAGNVVGAKFDGIQGLQVIDRKLNPVFSAKAVDQATRQVAVARHYGLQVVWELPTQQSVEAANRFLKTNRISGITVRVAP
jgi:RHS repeat-associated protein